MQAAKGRAITTAAALLLAGLAGAEASIPRPEASAELAGWLAALPDAPTLADLELEPAPATTTTALPAAAAVDDRFGLFHPGPEAGLFAAGRPLARARLEAETRLRVHDFELGVGVELEPLEVAERTGFTLFGGGGTRRGSENRWYDPELGRFTTTDPLGYVDGPNLYQYGLNNPVNFSDPLGLDTCPDCREPDRQRRQLEREAEHLRREQKERGLEQNLILSSLRAHGYDVETKGVPLPVAMDFAYWRYRRQGLTNIEANERLNFVFGPGVCGDALCDVMQIVGRNAETVEFLGKVVGTIATGYLFSSAGLFAYADDAAMWRGMPPPRIPPKPSTGPIKNLSGNLDEAAHAARTQPYYPMPPEPTWRLGSFKSAQKWQNQMQARGWTPRQITEAMRSGEQFPATNLVNPGNDATRYVHPWSGRSVVVDDATGEVLHVGGDGFLY